MESPFNCCYSPVFVTLQLFEQLFEAEDIAITMLCWGNASYGQLGLGGIDEEIIVEPRKCDFFNGKVVRDVGCGRRYTVFLLEDGTVYTCGCNDLGQLGHDKARKKPGTEQYACICK